MTTVAAATELDHVIETVTAWDWAKSERSQGVLHAKLKATRSDLTPWQRAFLSEEPATIKKRHDKAVIEVELRAMQINAVALSELSEFVKLLQRRHVA